MPSPRKEDRPDGIGPEASTLSGWGHVRQAQRKQRGHDPERDVDDEDRAPREDLGEVGAEHWTQRARSGEQRREISGVAAALARCHVLTDQCLRQRHEPAATQALHRAQDHESAEARCQGTTHRRSGEDREREEQRAAPAEAVAEVTVQRRGDGRRKEIRHHDPRQVGDCVERVGDARQRAREDRLVDRGQEHRDDDAREDTAESACARDRVAGASVTEAQWITAGRSRHHRIRCATPPSGQARILRAPPAWLVTIAGGRLRWTRGVASLPPRARRRWRSPPRATWIREEGTR